MVFVNFWKKRDSDFSILLRILSNFVQIMTSAISFNVKKPESLDKAVSAFGFISQNQDMIISYDCFLKDAFPAFVDSVFLLKVFLSPFFSFGLFFLLSIFALILKLILRKRLYFWRLLVITLITLFFTLYSRTSSNIIDLFNCKSIEN